MGGSHAERDHRLTERDDDDQPVALGEVARRDVGASSATDHDARVDNNERDHPQRLAPRAIDECGHEDEDGCDRLSGREAHERAGHGPVAPRADPVERQVDESHDEVGDSEEHALAAECARDGEGDEEHRSHRGEHARADDGLLGLERVGKPGIPGPQPPDRREDEQSVPDAPPREIVRHELGDLRDREHHHQVEEQLQGRDALFALDRSIDHRYEVVGRGISLIVADRACGVSTPPAMPGEERRYVVR